MDAQIKINGDLIRAMREQKSWSQEHLASASGLSVRTIQRVESEGVASGETRLALAAAFDVPVAALTVASPSPAVGFAQAWHVSVWVWLVWGIATAGTFVIIAFGYSQRTLLSQMAVNLFPLFALVGGCLGAIALIGAWQRTHSRVIHPPGD